MIAFDKLDKDVIDEWRGDPTTESFIAHVVGVRSALVSQVVDTAKGGSVVSARMERLGGQLDMVDRFLEAMVRR